MNELALQFYNQAPPILDPEWKYASLDKCLKAIALLQPHLPQTAGNMVKEQIEQAIQYFNANPATPYPAEQLEAIKGIADIGQGLYPPSFDYQLFSTLLELVAEAEKYKP